MDKPTNKKRASRSEEGMLFVGKIKPRPHFQSQCDGIKPPGEFISIKDRVERTQTKSPPNWIGENVDKWLVLLTKEHTVFV